MSLEPQQLAPYRRLFEAFRRRQVPFALFKGLDKVDAVLGGKDGDVDVLLQEDMRAEVGAAFADARFHTDAGAIDRLGRTVLVYRAFDAQSADFAMVHAYYQLLLGDRFEFRYAHEACILAASIERNGYRTVGSDHEWIIRAFNDLAKRRFDDPYLVALGEQVGTTSPVINDGLQRYAHIAFSDLLAMFERRDTDGLEQLRRGLFAPESTRAPASLALAGWFVRKAGRGWRRTPFSRIRNKVGISRSIALSGPDPDLAEDVATQIAVQLAPVARVKLLRYDDRQQASRASQIRGRLDRLKAILFLRRGTWVVLLGGPHAFPADLHVHLEACGLDERQDRWFIDPQEHEARAIASMIIEEGLRHSATR